MRDALPFDALSQQPRGGFVRMTAKAVARSVGGVVFGSSEVMISGAEVDSRIVSEGDLFIALPGDRVDGHTFVPTALEVASAALVRNDADLPPVPADRALISVVDPLAAYHHLAAEECRRRSWKVAAITGSVGKTTTKDFLAHMLGNQWVTGWSEGNRNSTLGLPAQILSQNDDIEIFVAEAGMSSAGELDLLGSILQPDVLLYTRITPAHTEFFSGMHEIVEAKAELIPHLVSKGILVTNVDDPRQKDFARRTDAKVLTYGTPQADASLEGLEDLGLLGTRGILNLPSGKAPFRLPLPGLHQAENFLAASTAAFAMGLPIDTISACAENLTPAPHRGAVISLQDEITVIDDSYNASPAAVERALALLSVSPGRRVAVLGEMFELGAAAAAAHRTIGQHAASCCDLLLAVGDDMGAALIEGAVAAGLPHHQIHMVKDSAAAMTILKGLLEPGDTILVKGSRGVGLDRLVLSLSERSC